MEIQFIFVNPNNNTYVSPAFKWDGDINWFYTDFLHSEWKAELAGRGLFEEASIDGQGTIDNSQETIYVRWRKNAPLAKRLKAIKTLSALFEAPSLTNLFKWL